MTADPSVALVIDRYRPRSLSEEVSAFCRSVVAAGSPHSCAQAKSWLFAAGRIGTFCVARGVALDPCVVLSSALIERYIRSDGAQLKAPTRRTVRSSLRAMRAAVVPAGARELALPRERSKPPYGDAEIEAYLALAQNQPTVARRHRATGLVCLGAGAGLMGGDLRGVRGVDVTRRSGGVVVSVLGAHARVVPVRSVFCERLLASAAFAGEHFIIGGRQFDRRTVTTPLVSSLAGGSDLAPLDTGRLRATWLVACAGSLGLRAFMDAAGVRCTQRLGDLVAQLEAPPEQTAVALLS